MPLSDLLPYTLVKINPPGAERHVQYVAAYANGVEAKIHLERLMLQLPETFTLCILHGSDLFIAARGAKTI